MATPLQPNLIANRTPTTPPPSTGGVDFGRLQKQFADSAKATGDYLKSLASIEIGFGRVNKSAVKTTQTVKAVDRTINVLGQTFKGTGKELIQVATALGVVSGAFFDLQLKSNLVIAPLKGVVDALGAISDKSKGVEIAQAIGVDTTGIQQLELFRAGLFGNVEALNAFRTGSQTAGISFTLNLTKLNTILKASKDELKAVGQEARKLSKDLGGAVSSTDIVAGQYQIASAGFTKAGDSRAIAEASGKLATVGFNDFFSTADLVTKSLRAYGLEASKAGDIAAKLNAAVEVGITTIPELAAGFGETAVVANAFGISIEQALAAVATITTQGSSTPEALTGIEALLRTLANQAPQATKALSELSLNGQRVKFDIATVQAKGLGNALTDVFKAANGNVEVLREIIPESRALQAALALAAQGGSLFADSLDKVSQSSPTKLNDIFGEVQEDPTIKLKAITTRASELVGSLSGTYEKFTDGAIGSLAQFVSITEAVSKAITSNPIASFIGSNFLFLVDTINKVVGVFGALGGAAASVIGTLVSINVFNNLFNGGLLKQGKLIYQSIAGLQDFGLAAKQVIGIDTSKSVITGLSKQIDDLKAKNKDLGLVGDTTAIDANNTKIKELTNNINNIQKAANKPANIALVGISKALAEVKALDAQINALGADDPARVDLLNKQRDAIGRVGEERLRLETEIRKQEREGSIDADKAAQKRARGNAGVSAVSGLANKDQALFDSVKQTTTITSIRQALEAENAKGAGADQKRVANLVGSLEQINKGQLGVLNSAGKLENVYKRTSSVGEFLGRNIAKGWDFAINGFRTGTKELGNIDQALRVVAKSESIDNLGAATGRLIVGLGRGLGAITGLNRGLVGLTDRIKGLAVAGATAGAALIGQLVNPLTVAFAAFQLFSDFQKRQEEGQKFQDDLAQKFAEAEANKGKAVRDTNRALEDQVKIQKLVAGGLSEKEAREKLAVEKKESNIRTALPQLTGDRAARAQRQLQAGDFRTSTEFAEQEIGRLRENKLGIGTDNGEAVGKTNARNITTGIAVAVPAIAGGIIAGTSAAAAVAGAKFGATVGGTLGSILGPVGTGVGILIGTAAGALIGLVFAEGIRKLQGNAELEEIKKEASARDRLEQEKKFRLSEAKTPQERATRQKKVDDAVSIGDANRNTLIAQSELDNNVFKELNSSKDARLFEQGKNLGKIRDQLVESNKLLIEADKSFKENRVPEGLFGDDALTTKVNALLAGTGSTSIEDLQRVDASLKDKIKEFEATKEQADFMFNTFKDAGNEGAATQAKKQAEQAAADIERLSQFTIKLRPKLELKNQDIQNAVKNGQGVIATISNREFESARNSIQALTKASKEDATKEERDSVANNIEALSASLEVLNNTNPEQAISTLQQLRSLLSGEDVLKLPTQQLAKLQNVLGTATLDLGEKQIAKFEALLRRTQSVASSADTTAGRAGQEAQADAELALLDVKIQKQEQSVANAQGAAAKERANNDLIQLQLDKKNKTIEARIQKEQNAADRLFEKEKARLDLQKSALELAQVDFNIKKQAFETFGLQTEGVNTDLAKNALNQRKNDTATRIAALAKERADLVRTQQEGLEKANAAGLNKPQEIIFLRVGGKQESTLAKNTIITSPLGNEQKEELARFDARVKAQEELLKKQEKELQFAIDIAEAYDGVLNPLDRQSKLLVDSASAAGQILATTQQLNPLYLSQEALQGSVATGAALQVVSAKRTLDVEKQKLDIQEKLLQKNGLLTDDVKKQLADKRTLLDTNFKQQTVAIAFEAKQSSIDAFAKKLQTTIENKLKALDIQKTGLATFADSFGEDGGKDAEKAKKLAGALSINIAVQQAALAEQILKTEQEKTLNQLKQNDLQLQFLDIQLQVQASQTKDKELLDGIAKARGSISGLRANIGQEIKDAPARFAEQQALQRKQSVLAVSSASLDFTKQFDPKNLKTEQASFLRQNGLDLNQPLGDTSVNGAVASLSAQSAANQKDFAAITQQQQQRQQPVQQVPIRREADGSITNQPPNYTVNINVAGTNATPQEIGKVVRQEMLNTTKELLRRS